MFTGKSVDRVLNSSTARKKSTDFSIALTTPRTVSLATKPAASAKVKHVRYQTGHLTIAVNDIAACAWFSCCT